MKKYFSEYLSFSPCYMARRIQEVLKYIFSYFKQSLDFITDHENRKIWKYTQYDISIMDSSNKKYIKMHNINGISTLLIDGKHVAWNNHVTQCHELLPIAMAWFIQTSHNHCFKPGIHFMNNLSLPIQVWRTVNFALLRIVIKHHIKILLMALQNAKFCYDVIARKGIVTKRIFHWIWFWSDISLVL